MKSNSLTRFSPLSVLPIDPFPSDPFLPSDPMLPKLPCFPIPPPIPIPITIPPIPTIPPPPPAMTPTPPGCIMGGAYTPMYGTKPIGSYGYYSIPMPGMPYS